MQFRRNRTRSHTTISGKRHDASFRLIPRAASLTLIAFSSLLPGLLPGGNSVHAAPLHYDAFLSGLPIGSAVVVIDLTADAYRISGSATSQGIAHLFSDWRADFLAAGRLRAGTPMLTTYAYDERERKKQKVLRLSGGTVIEVKDNQVRPSHPAHTGTDILTAFFLQADCWSERQLHTGRYSYQVTGHPAGESGGCHFSVSDSDGDRTRFHVRFGEYEGLRVPIEATTKGLLRGRIRLRAVSTPAAANRDGADMRLAEHP